MSEDQFNYYKEKALKEMSELEEVMDCPMYLKNEAMSELEKSIQASIDSKDLQGLRFNYFKLTFLLDEAKAV